MTEKELTHEEICARIVSYWAAQGKTVKAWVEQIKRPNPDYKTSGGPQYHLIKEIRTSLGKTGMPS